MCLYKNNVHPKDIKFKILFLNSKKENKKIDISRNQYPWV